MSARKNPQKPLEIASETATRDRFGRFWQKITAHSYRGSEHFQKSKIFSLPYPKSGVSKLTWLVLGEDQAARSHRVEQLTAL